MSFWNPDENPKARFLRQEHVLNAFVGVRMKTLREQAGLTLQQGADCLYIFARKLEGFESGKHLIPFIKISRLAEAYGCELADFDGGFKRCAQPE